MPFALRAGTERDLPALTAIYNDYVLRTPITFDTQPYSVEQRRELWFSQYADTGPHRLLVAEQDERVLGYATSGPFRPKPAYDTSVETTVYLAPDATGRRVGSALYGTLLEVLVAEAVHRAYAGVALPNDASLALHRRHGFTEVGTFREVGYKLGRFWDVLWLERALTPPGPSGGPGSR